MLEASEILNASILIVDDQPANVTLLRQMLRKAGYTNISSTMTPQEVARMHQIYQYDLILLDLMMPGMDGFQVMQALKEDAPDDYLPVLVITAEPAHKLRALKEGAKDFVSKPVDLLEVQTRIYNMLEVRLLYKKLENYNRMLEQRVLERTAELRASEARFRRLTELSSDWYWEQDEHGRFTKVSGPVLEMLGIVSDPDAQDDASWNREERAALAQALAERKPFLDFVYSRTNPDGSHQYLQTSGEPMYDDEGRFMGYRGIGIDITERMRPEEGLRRFRRAMEVISDAIFLLDRNSMCFVDVNDTACELVGYSRGQLLGLGPAALGMGSRDVLDQVFDEIVTGEQGHQFQRRELRRRDDKQVPVEIHWQAARRTGEERIMVAIAKRIEEEPPVRDEYGNEY
ncbi:PAS domain S-box protein [Massilia sp. W12]|uniref:PAS domain S-box protein n=1 Tax=Massilia sp. W12 TaxID=3126507 RepID=UPI0030CDD5AA